MKEYVTNKNVLIGILLLLMGLSIVDVVLRTITFSDIGVRYPITVNPW